MKAGPGGCPRKKRKGHKTEQQRAAVRPITGSFLRFVAQLPFRTDTLGQYFNSQLRSAGVRCLLDTHQHHAAQHALHPQPHDQHPQPTHPTQQPQQQPAHSAQQQQQHPSPEGHTGTVMVLTTPDAQRSFLSFFTSDRLALSERLRSAVRGCRLVVMEGYLWEMEGAEAYMAEVIRIAHAAGAQVAMTAGDPGVVARHREEMLRTIARGVDMVFTVRGGRQGGRGCGSEGAGRRGRVGGAGSGRKPGRLLRVWTGSSSQSRHGAEL